MRKTLILMVFAMLSLGTAIAKDVKTSFAVNGKCGMCKNNIEAAAKSVPGVEDAKWCKKGKKLTVSFDDSKTSVKTIQKKVAAAGYDTDKYKASKKVYNALPECCKYRNGESKEITGSCCAKENKEEKQSKQGCCGEKKAEKKSCCSGK